MKKTKRVNGFSLVELVIVVVIIGVIAAVAVPRISRGAKGAGDAALRASLAGLRNAIDMYAAEHGGVFPDGASQAIIETKLIETTDFMGNAGVDYGPYLRSGFPPLSVGENKGSSLIIITTGVPVPDATSVGTGEGWIYSTDKGSIVANSLLADDNSINYSDY